MMSDMNRIGLLRMTEFVGVTRDMHGTYAALFEEFFKNHPVEIVDVPMHEGASPESLDDCDGWVITGSPASVYEDLDWIATGEEIVRAALAEERPMVGICFGHQLIAQALGGRVEKASVGWGIGAQRYDTIRALPQLEQSVATTLLASHQDQVVELPDDASVWSSADYCPFAGFTVGERMLTMQGHPEFTPQLVTTLYDSRRDRLGDAAVDAAMTTLGNPLSNDSIAAAIVRLIAG
jgi:GMP synthase-like glutamine amidotransferase